MQLLRKFRETGDESMLGAAVREKPAESGILQLVDQPMGKGTNERWVYQQAMADAARQLGLGVDQTQSVDWHLKKYLDGLLGVNTPEGTGVSGLDQAGAFAREFGRPFDPSKRAPWVPGKEQAQKMLASGKLSPEEAQYLIDAAGLGKKRPRAPRAPRTDPPAPAIVAPPKRASDFVAYHGSPAKFDKFDLSKIGSGEGGAAYGRGIYLAESEDVAKFYRDMLVDRPTGDAVVYLPNGQRLTGDELSDELLNDVAHGRVKGKLRYEKSPGYLYKVAVDAAPDEILDYDAPLRRQPERVRAALPSTQPPSVEELLDNFLSSEYAKAFPYESSVRFGKVARKSGDPTDLEYWAEKWARPGSDAFHISGGLVPFHEDTKGQQLIGRFGQETFERAGIKGMRYLDQGSRDAGNGTRNFVAWRDDILDILKRYGLLGGALGAAAYGAQASPRAGD